MRADERPWHHTPVDAVVAALTVDPARGLDAASVRTRRDTYGPNALPPPPRPSVLRQILSQFLNPLVGTLLVAAGIAVAVAVWGQEPGASTGLARFSDAIAIVIIVVINAAIGFYQERKAERALDALRSLTAARCRVLREGTVSHLDAAELVPGDLVLLEAGDRVPADLRLVYTADMQCVEGELTGESTGVDKSALAAVPEASPLGDRSTMAWSGTTVVAGEARGVVVATGAATQVGRVGAMLAAVQKERSPLEARLEVFGGQVLWVCVALSVALFGIGALQGRGAWHVLLLMAVSVAVAVIPEGLPAITSITLALGMQRMAQQGALVRKLSAVETLGCATVVCSDKTGTLTRNEMTVRFVATADDEAEVTGEGYGFAGAVRLGGQEVSGSLPEALVRTIAVGVVANTATLTETGEGAAARQVQTGDPMEAALLALGAKAGASREATLSALTTEYVVPFSSDRKRMAVVTRDAAGQLRAWVKGGVDVLLPRCTHVRTAAGVVPLDDATRAALQARADGYSARALRVLAMAERLGDDTLRDRAAADEALTFLGMVGMIDPPRAEVRASIVAAHAAGLRVVMITGDHPITAQAIAEELGIWEPGAATLTGEALGRLDDAALAEVLPRVRVFARVDPAHKLRIVQALQDGRREVVAMTGDGVNDAPAIKQAAIGVAMGRGGTDVAREAADMVLQDDNFATIVEAIREGRAIYRNIQKSIFFLLSANAGLCVAVFAAGFLPANVAPPLSPLQILWINLVTNGLPALALGVDPPEADQMREPPRSPGEPILGRQDWVGIFSVGALMGGCALALYLAPIYTGDADEVMRSKVTLVFTLLALSPLAHAFNCRSRNASIATLGLWSNPLLVGAVIVSALVHCASLLVPALQPVFRSNHHWSGAEVGLVVALSLLPVPALELAKALRRAHARKVSPAAGL
jgi:Ca2+-transporting ATPase